MRIIIACLTIALSLRGAFGQDNFVPISPRQLASITSTLSDEASLAGASQLDAEVLTRTAFLRQELMQITDPQLATLVAHKPSLKVYLFAIESARRYRPHTLSLKEE